MSCNFYVHFHVNLRYYNHNNRLGVNEISKCFAQQRTRKSFSTINESTIFGVMNIRKCKKKKKKKIIIHWGLTSFMVDRFGAASIFQRPHVSIVAAVEIPDVSSRRRKDEGNCSPIQTTRKRSRLLPYGSSLGFSRSNQRTLPPAWLRRAPIS